MRLRIASSQTQRHPRPFVRTFNVRNRVGVTKMTYLGAEQTWVQFSFRDLTLDKIGSLITRIIVLDVRTAKTSYQRTLQDRSAQPHESRE